MKSYLSLIPISARVRKRQNRMTRLCIMMAVFLVTSVFSMAEMGARMEKTRLQKKHGALSVTDIFSSEMGQSLFLTASVLFILILIAGVLMITSSINSNVAQRTKFFGMMRCIGMSREQVIRFVRLEALSWCKSAVPIGVILGIGFTWSACAALRFLVGEEFSHIPLFGVSMIGVFSGILVGIVTVLIAAGAPAKRAAKVSPVTAVSGNSEDVPNFRYGVKTHGFKIETALGIHHATAARKNLVLMTGSFSLSIILFLSFNVLIEFVDYLMPQFSNTEDISISTSDGANSISSGLLDTINSMEGVKRVFGRRSSLDVPAMFDKEQRLSSTVDLISFDEFELQCLSKDDILKRGSHISKVSGDSNYVLATWDQESTLEIGDKIWINHEQLEIAGLLKYDMFSNDGRTNGKITLITSADTFTRLTGVSDYALLMVQTASDITEEEVTAIRSLAEGTYTFRDKREQSTRGTYTAFVFCVYGFLAVITLVAVLNIINSIAMSVFARIKQYGAMRAVGMEERQAAKMIIAEALTYAAAGCVIGGIIGLLMHKWLFDILIRAHFSYALWRAPVTSLMGIILFAAVTVGAAVYAPLKRMHHMDIAEIINEL